MMTGALLWMPAAETCWEWARRMTASLFLPSPYIHAGEERHAAMPCHEKMAPCHAMLPCCCCHSMPCWREHICHTLLMVIMLLPPRHGHAAFGLLYHQTNQDAAPSINACSAPHTCCCCHAMPFSSPLPLSLSCSTTKHIGCCTQCSSHLQLPTPSSFLCYMLLVSLNIIFSPSLFHMEYVGEHG